MKKIFIILIALSSLSFARPEYKSFLLGDDKGEIYIEDNIDEVRPLASLTKMMTALIVFDEVREGKIKLNDNVTISSKAASVPYGIQLSTGQTLSVEDLLKATIIRSSNNAAYALAEHIGYGSAESFVREMNDKAYEFGLNSIRYCTPHGLPPSNTGTCMDQGSARDVYKLGQIVATYPEYLRISDEELDYIGPYGDIQVKTTNNLLKQIPSIDGMKTGYHSEAGSNIVLTANENGMRIITVILGASKATLRDDYGYDQIIGFYNSHKKLEIANENKALAKVTVGQEEYNLYPKETVSKTVNSYMTQDELKYEIIYDEEAIKKAKKGDEAGYYRVFINGEEFKGALVRG